MLSYKFSSGDELIVIGYCAIHNEQEPRTWEVDDFEEIMWDGVNAPFRGI